MTCFNACSSETAATRPLHATRETAREVAQ
jgi:hypothetical protein